MVASQQVWLDGERSAFRQWTEMARMDLSNGNTVPVALPATAHLASRYFRHLTDTVLRAKDDCRIVLVTHILPDRPPLLDALSKLGEIAMIIPKPKSIDEVTLTLLAQSYPIVRRTREQLAIAQDTKALLEQYVGDEPFVIADIGGYFAEVVEDLGEHFGDQFLGIVEDTENGYKRYLEHAETGNVQIYSVARSPLKEPEDHLVGESVVFSMERLIRSCGEVIFGRRAVVFGFGKVGRSAARALSARGARVSIVETNPVRAVEAQAHGFRALSKPHALATADLILGATGRAFSLKRDDFLAVRNGAFIASVTSSDDELDMNALPEEFEITETTANVTCYSRQGQYFYVLNEGNAVNFIDGAVVGPYIYLVQGEILAAISLLKNGRKSSEKIRVVSDSMREKVGKSWIEFFASDHITIPGKL